MTSTTIDLIRHGEPLGGKKYRGQLDDPLSETGWRQMWDAVGEFSGWHRLVTSPLSRCAAFAQALHEKWAIPLSQDPRLMEVGFGAWEGRTAEELQRADPGVVAAFRCDPLGSRPAGAEPLGDFYDRVSAAWDDLLAAHEGRHLLVVCHAGVIRMVLARVLGIPLANIYHIQVSTAGLTRIVAEGRGEHRTASLLFHNERRVRPPAGGD